LVCGEIMANVLDKRNRLRYYAIECLGTGGAIHGALETTTDHMRVIVCRTVDEL
jgi:hypothetical protein